MKTEKKKYYTKELLIIFVITLLIVVGYTMARYASSYNGAVTFRAANWTFDVNVYGEEVQDNYVVNLMDTATRTVTSDKLAPGTEGEITFNIDCRGSETGVQYILKYTDVNSNFPAGLKLYSNESCTEEFEITKDFDYIGYLNLQEVNTVLQKRVYWKWIAEDTTEANESDAAVSGETITLGVKITGVQHTGPVPSGETDAIYFQVNNQGILNIKENKIEAFRAEVTQLILPYMVEGVIVTGIAPYAFANMDNITGVTIPNNIETIGNGAFVQCKNINFLNIEGTIHRIGNVAFKSCAKLNRAILGTSLKEIGGWAFSDCTKLKTVYIPPDVTGLEDAAFYNCTVLEAINLPTAITSIGRWAFWECMNITNVVMPNSLETIGEGAFGMCYKLKTVTFNTGLKTIGDSSFFKCVLLDNITIPASVENIEDLAFEDCENLTTVNITSSTVYTPTSFYGTPYRL